MPSLLPGYEYDIFISYRQKDNKGDRWVTEFVGALRAELESTFKENISIYFDENPHDGLLETHNVDKTLEGKLRCLIFIPIISQTYCDPKSFAWQHEFCAFNRMAQQDALGRDLKLVNGNVASRILPMKIHDLDSEDKNILETELGGALRAIEFIFKSAGVNRPLRASEDHPQDNLNKTFYRDQINKVANAIKEITASSKLLVNKVNENADVTSAEMATMPPRPTGKKVTFITVGMMVLLALVYGISSYVGSAAEEPVGMEKSIAVLPFVNMSNDADQEYFSDGMTEQIITNLAHINSLKVIARTSVMKFKKTGKSIGEIGKELNVTHVLEGSIRKAGNRIRVTAQLIAVHDESHLWAQDYDNDLADIFTVQDEVSAAIASSLKRKLTPREYESIKSDRSSNVEAYEHYLKGFYIHNDLFFVKRLKEDFEASEIEFKKSIALDSGYASSYAGLADLYDTYRNFVTVTKDERMKIELLRDYNAHKAFKLGPSNPYATSVMGYTFLNRENRNDSDLDSAFKYARRALALAPNNAQICDVLSTNYRFVGLLYQSLQLRERTITLDPTYGDYHATLGGLYLILGDFRKAESEIQKAILMEPDGYQGLSNWAILSMTKKDFAEAEKTIEKIKDINQGNDTYFLETYLLALKGEKERALSRIKPGLNYPELTYLALGMRKEALDALEKRGQYLFMKNFPVFSSLQNDPSFKKILEKAKVAYEARLKKYAN